MGSATFDQYSYLHMATGVIMYFFGFSFWMTIFVHIIFEAAENTELGMLFINRYLGWIWPGKKKKADSVENNIGDTIATAIGWITAYMLDDYAKKHNWYY